MEQDVLPPPTDTGSGFEAPRIRQFTIFMANRVGRLQMLVRALEDVTGIVAMSVEESADSSLVRVVCRDSDACREAVRSIGLSFTESELLGVALPGRSTQPITQICAAVLAAEINIHYAYPMLASPRGPALVMFVEDPTLAAQLLIKKGFVILGESDFKPRPAD